MRIVIKFAGALLEDGVTMRSLARQVAALAQDARAGDGSCALFCAKLRRV